RADRFAALHEIEAFVDAFKRQGVRNEIVDIDLAVHIPVDDARYIGAATRATKCRSLPDSAGDQLEWPRGDLGAGFGHTDNDRLAPAAVAAFQCLAHDLGIADTFERIVSAAI